MKEVFANFMADKLANDGGKNQTYDLQFLLEHYPSS